MVGSLSSSPIRLVSFDGCLAHSVRKAEVIITMMIVGAGISTSPHYSRALTSGRLRLAELSHNVLIHRAVPQL